MSCRWFEASFVAYVEDPERGFVFEREREEGRDRLKKEGDVALVGSGGAVLSKMA